MQLLEEINFWEEGFLDFAEKSDICILLSGTLDVTWSARCDDRLFITHGWRVGGTRLF